VILPRDRRCKKRHRPSEGVGWPVTFMVHAPRGGNQKGCSLLRRGATTGVTIIPPFMTEPVGFGIGLAPPGAGLAGMDSTGAPVLIGALTPPQPQLEPQDDSQQSFFLNLALILSNSLTFGSSQPHPQVGAAWQQVGAGAQQVGAGAQHGFGAGQQTGFGAQQGFGAGQQTGFGAQQVGAASHPQPQSFLWKWALILSNSFGFSQQASVAQPQPPPHPPPIGADTTGAAGATGAGAASAPASHAVVSMIYAAFTIDPPGAGPCA
jgi:hypothetical protein